MPECHYHNKQNKHVGTGIAENDVEMAAQRAIGSAVQSADTKQQGFENLERGSLGCGATSKEAHQNAMKANSQTFMDTDNQVIKRDIG